jgi:hypothetical protein
VRSVYSKEWIDLCLPNRRIKAPPETTIIKKASKPREDSPLNVESPQPAEVKTSVALPTTKTTNSLTWTFDAPDGKGDRVVRFIEALGHPKSGLPKKAFKPDPWMERIYPPHLWR